MVRTMSHLRFHRAILLVTLFHKQEMTNQLVYATELQCATCTVAR